MIDLRDVRPRGLAEKDKKQGELKNTKETVEKPVSERLMEGVQMQNFRNWGHPPAGWGVQAERGQIPSKCGHLPC